MAAAKTDDAEVRDLATALAGEQAPRARAFLQRLLARRR